MGTVLKLLGGLAAGGILVVAGAVADFALDDGRLIYGLLGRDRIEAACRPELARALAERGFAPADIEFAGRPILGVQFGREARLSSTFTFMDGAQGERVDGTMACVVSDSEARVEVQVRATPRRTA